MKMLYKSIIITIIFIISDCNTRWDAWYKKRQNVFTKMQQWASMFYRLHPSYPCPAKRSHQFCFFYMQQC